MTKKLTKCEDCKKPLPIHMLGIAPNFRTICSCTASYEDKNGVFVRVGNERNPVAEYDEAQKKAKKAKKVKNCKCVDKVLKELEKNNEQLVLAFTMKGQAFPVIETMKIDVKKRTRRKMLVATFCPFCGKKYEKK